MHDLRRQALESGKTVSRKARSKQSTPASSRTNSPGRSRAVSRSGNVSRAGSDEGGDGELSDETSFSVGSLDEMLNGDGDDETPDAWAAYLADRIEEILARKGSTVSGREKCYKSYIHLLTNQYAEEEIRGKEGELVTAFLKSIKEEKSENETVLAIKAIAITLITSPSDQIYEAVSTPLKHTIQDSLSLATKTAAIHALSACTFWGGASEEEVLDIMDFLLEIITSDGNTINAPDEPEPVVAALEDWGFLCTQIDDMSEQSEEAIEAFAEQIDSSYTSVQIAAGEDIALLFEKSFRPFDPDDDSAAEFSDADLIPDPDDDSNRPKLIRLYPAYRRADQLTHSISSIANPSLSAHHISKTSRKALRTTFNDVLDSITNPTHGPRYQNAINDETGQRYGSRMVVKIHKGGVMRIDKWWKLARLQGLRRVLQGGFVRHYERNEVVFETLPIMITNGR
ncbi:hypothetical protein MMC21_001744 [Puttea exsequens]|nr:hypothetical protein [Puttea exsequens]